MSAEVSMYPDYFVFRFWQKVRKAGGNRCWEWQGRPALSGYGQVQCRGVSQMPMLCHRVSWELANGPIPDGQHVLHECDNRICVRPSHLFLGTQRDNNEDRQQKGRTAAGDCNGARTRRERNPFVRNGGSGLKGETHPMCRLTDAEVARLKSLFHTGRYTRTALAEQFGISVTHTSRIISGKSRKE